MLTAEAGAMPQWKQLKPHVPLEPGDPSYVKRPREQDVVEEIAARLKAGTSTHLVVGTAGVGKSTELRRLHGMVGTGAVLLDDDSASVPGRNARFLRAVALALGKGLSHQEELEQAVSGALTGARFRDPTARFDAGAEDAAVGPLQNLVLQAVRLRTQDLGPVVLLLDGLERNPDWRSYAALLATLQDEMSLVAVAPVSVTWTGEAEVAFGGRATIHALTGFRDSTGEVSVGRFVHLLEQRLGAVLPTELVKPVREAAAESGGVPRTFLQIMAEAHVQAEMAGRTPWPNEADMTAARARLAKSLRYLLRPGDKEQLKKWAGTDGSEIRPEDKVRYLGHGFLLETGGADKLVLELNPALRGFL